MRQAALAFAAWILQRVAHTQLRVLEITLRLIMPPKRPRSAPVLTDDDAVAVRVLFELLSVLQSLVKLSSRLTTLLHEVRHMALNPQVQAKLDEVKASVTAEADQVKTKVQSIIDAINAGADPTELLAQLDDIKTGIDAISESFGTTPTEPPVTPP